MRTPKLFLVPLVLTLSAYVVAQSPIASPQPGTAGMPPGVATPMQPSQDPIVKPVPPVVRREEKAPQPNVNLQVPLPERALIRRIAMIDIPGRPGFKDLEFINGYLVMAHPAASTVDVFSVTKRRVIAQIIPDLTITARSMANSWSTKSAKALPVSSAGVISCPPPR